MSMPFRYPLRAACLGVAAVVLSTPAALAQSPAPFSTARPEKAPLTLEQVMQAARDNLDVAIARRTVDAARADVTSADHVPVPVIIAKTASIDLQHGIGPGNLLRDKRIDKSIGIDWTWERGNKRELRTQQARRNVDAAEADLREVQVQQQLQAASAFYDLLAAQERVAQVEAIGRSAAELSGTAARRVRAGDLSAQDAARTEIESQRASADLQSARADRRRAAMALAQLIGVTPDGALRTAGGTPVTADGAYLSVQPGWPALAAPDAAAMNSSSSVNVSVDARGDVLAATQRLQAAQAALDGAQALRKNDVTLGTTFDHFPGTSTRQLEFRAQVPLAGILGAYGYDGEIAKARAQLDLAQQQADKTRRVAVADAQRQQADLDVAAERAQRYSSAIVPRARQVADMAELAYSKGAMSLTELIDARRTLRNVLIEDIAARADHARNLAAWRLRHLPAP
jgi:cobalt-zinc-cadmium efflux system outer membrane protein